MQFAGYRRMLNYGWIPKITWEEYVSNDAWEYFDCDEEDLTIVACNTETGSFAWVGKEEEK